MTIYTPLPEAPPRTRRLWRAGEGRLLGGVAAGLADYLSLDVVVVRVVLVALALAGGFAVPVYLAAWLLVPDETTGESVAERVLGRRPSEWAEPYLAATDERSTDGPAS